MDTNNYFTKLMAIDVSSFTKSKAKSTLKYLPWAKAVELLLREDPNATWVFGPDVWLPNGTVIVHSKVTAFGITREMHSTPWEVGPKGRPVAIKNPDANQILNAHQRCLTKNIAVFGIGLSLWLDEEKIEDDAKGEDAGGNGKKSAPESQKPSALAPAADAHAPAPSVTIAPRESGDPVNKIYSYFNQYGVSQLELDTALGCRANQVPKAAQPFLTRFKTAIEKSPKDKAKHLRDLSTSMASLETF